MAMLISRQPMSLVMICTFMDLAYTARALVGLLTTAGLPSTTLLNTKHLKHIREATINLSLAVVQPSHLAQCLTEMILDPSNQIIDEAYRFYATSKTTLMPRSQPVRDVEGHKTSPLRSSDSGTPWARWVSDKCAQVVKRTSV